MKEGKMHPSTRKISQVKSFLSLLLFFFLFCAVISFCLLRRPDCHFKVQTFIHSFCTFYCDCNNDNDNERQLNCPSFFLPFIVLGAQPQHSPSTMETKVDHNNNNKKESREIRLAHVVGHLSTKPVSQGGQQWQHQRIV